MLNQKLSHILLLWCSVLCLVIPRAGTAQNPVFTRFTEEEGLPGNDVYDLLVADNGYVWFATDNGVSRYDGNEFVNFNVTHGLPANSVLKLYEDMQGRIWFTGYNGMLSYFDGRNITAYRYNDTLVKYFHDNYFNKIYVDSLDGIRLSPRQGGFAYIDQNGWNHSRAGLAPFHVDSCYLSFEDRGEDYFLTIVSTKPEHALQQGRLAYVDSTYYLSVEFTHREFQRNYIKLGRDTYLVSYRNCVYYIKDHKLVTCRTFDEEVLSLYADNKGKIWVCVKYDHGVFMFDDASLEGDGTHSLEGYTVTSIKQDMEDNYWFGTEGHGVFFTPGFEFRLFLPDDLQNLNVMALAVSGNRIWFTSRDKQLYAGELSEAMVDKIRRVDIGEPYDWIRHIVVDDDGYLWLSSTRYLRYDPGGFPCPLDTVINTNFLGKGNGDTVFVASRRLGIYEGGKLTALLESDPIRRTYSVFHDKNGDIWLGTLYGLYQFTNGEIRFKGDILPALGERISCIDRINDMLVVGTSAYGLVFLKGDSLAFHITTDDGLTGNPVKAIYVQNDTVLWAGTKKGLNKLVITSGGRAFRIESYSQGDGLPSGEINSIEMHEGHIWLGTGSGLVSFDPLKLRPHIVPPIIQIRNIQINGNDTVLLDRYALAPEQNDIRISFGGISYRSGGVFRYRYMLSNYNDHIVETKNKWANFPNLPPGDYTFFVNVGNAHGIWNENPESIEFSIRKPFSQTVMFMVLVIVLSSATVVAVSMYFQRQKKIKQDARNELIRMEQKLFRLQMNPHFVFNALLAIQGFMHMNQPREAGRYLTSFAKLIRHTLYGSSEDFITLDKEVEALRYYLELQRLRFNEQFDFKVSIDEKLIPETTLLPPLLLQPFLENAIEHGLQHKEGKGTLQMDLRLQDDHLVVTIEDDGIGRDESSRLHDKKGRLHKSMGLEIIKKRLESLNKFMPDRILLEITDLHEGDRPSGTLVSLHIPIRYA
jgi:ligand-binding sensor domain-containing protein